MLPRRQLRNTYMRALGCCYSLLPRRQLRKCRIDDAHCRLCLLPRRQLRKARLRRSGCRSRLLPRRQLRKSSAGGQFGTPSLLPRRQLRKSSDRTAVATKIVEGSWCPHCAMARHGELRRSRDGLERLRAVARSRRGECLDDLYEGANLKYRFRCERGHEWAAVGNLVLGGTWCGRCANLAKRRTLEQMQAVARERGGRCLSTAYLGNQIKLTWQCKLGHVWESSPNNAVNRGAWCPNCFRLRITRNPVLRRRYDAGG